MGSLDILAVGSCHNSRVRHRFAWPRVMSEEGAQGSWRDVSQKGDPPCSARSAHAVVFETICLKGVGKVEAVSVARSLGGGSILRKFGFNGVWCKWA